VEEKTTSLFRHEGKRGGRKGGKNQEDEDRKKRRLRTGEGPDG